MKLTKSQLRELIRNSIRSVVSEEDDGKYTHIGYGKYKEKGKEKDDKAPTFKKDDSGKYTPIKGDEPTAAPTDKEKPKPKMTKIKADPFADKGSAADDEADDIDRDARFAADDDEYDVGGPAHPNVPKKKKKESVKESKGRRCTVKEVKLWMKTLEENRYKKTYQSDARRIAWAIISQEPHVQRAIQAQLNARIDRVQKKEQTSLLNEVQPLLQYQPK